MPTNGSNSRSERSKPFHWVGDSIGQIAFPIRAKLLFTFLLVVGLMIALALMGMSELRKANIRAAELVDDQVRISTLRAVERSVQAVKTVAAEMFLNQGDGATNEELSQRLYDEVFLFRAASAQTGNPSRATHFLMPKFEQEFYAKERSVSTAAAKMRAQFTKGDIAAAKAVYDNDFSGAVGELERVIFSIYLDLRERMSARADKNNAAFERSRRLIMGASGFAVALATMLGIAISASITRPLNRIRRVLGQLSGGAFEARVKIPNRDELGDLADHVNQTCAELGELYETVELQKSDLASLNSALEDRVRKQVEVIERTNRLRRFLPAQVAGIIVDTPDEVEILRTQRAEITVLFADLRGFSAFSNAATPDQVVEALNTFHGTCGLLIDASGGTLERFLGDGLMVLFGAPVPIEDAAQRAVDLAKEMRTEVRQAMAPFEAGLTVRKLGVGIGVATGAATLGQIGYESRRDYSAIGPAPNLAARLCDVAKDGQILISHATAWQIECDVKPAGPFDLKGIGNEIAAFEV